MSIFDVYQAGQLARQSGLTVSVLNEREVLAFAQAVEQQVAHFMKTSPNLYDYSQVDIERAFKLAVTNSGIHLLPDMKGPKEHRPEGLLNAVSRKLATPGDDTDDGVAPGFYEQFYKEFSRPNHPRFIAFLSVDRLRVIDPGSFDSVWSFKIRYASIA